jgi:WD40 repeat protein
MKKFSLFLLVLTLCFLLNTTCSINSLGKQAAAVFIQQEGFTQDYFIEWAKDPQNEYIDTLSPEIKQAIASAIEKKFRGVLNFLFVRELVGHTDRVTAVACSKSGNFIATGSRDKTAKLWQRFTGELLATFEDTAEITAVALSDDESLLVTCSTTLKVWDVKTGQVKAKLLLDHLVHSIKISADNRSITIVYKNEHDHEHVWDSITNQFTACYKKTNERYTITIYRNHYIRLSDVITGYMLDSLETKHSYQYNAGSTTQETVVNSYRRPAYTQLYLSDSDRYTMTEYVRGTLELYDKIKDKKCLFKGHTSDIRAVALCPDKNICVSGSNDAQANVWDVTTGKLIVTLEGHTGAIYAVGISSDGRYVITGSVDKTVRIWHIGHLTGQLDFDALIAYLRDLPE